MSQQVTSGNPPPRHKKHSSLSVQVTSPQRSAGIREGRRFNKALNKSGLLDLSPMPNLISPNRLRQVSVVEEDKTVEDPVAPSELRALNLIQLQSADPELTFMSARANVESILEQHNKECPKQEPVDHDLVRELELKFNCDRVVAELACRKSVTQTLENMLDYIYGHDPQNLHKHPFVPFKINEKELDIENDNFAAQTAELLMDQ